MGSSSCKDSWQTNDQSQNYSQTPLPPNDTRLPSDEIQLNIPPFVRLNVEQQPQQNILQSYPELPLPSLPITNTSVSPQERITPDETANVQLNPPEHMDVERPPETNFDTDRNRTFHFQDEGAGVVDDHDILRKHTTENNIPLVSINEGGSGQGNASQSSTSLPPVMPLDMYCQEPDDKKYLEKEKEKEKEKELESDILFDRKIYKSIDDYWLEMYLLKYSVTNENRTNIINRNKASYRASDVYVNRIEHKFTGETVNSIKSNWNGIETEYVVGYVIHVNNFDMTLNKEMSSGLHYVLDKNIALHSNMLSLRNNGYSGEYESYFPNGILWEKGSYSNGGRVGRWLSYRNSNTQDMKLYKDANYVNGVLHGKYAEYHANGKLFLDGMYNNDQRDGLWTEFSEACVQISRGTYRNGIILKDTWKGEPNSWESRGRNYSTDLGIYPPYKKYLACGNI